MTAGKNKKKSKKSQSPKEEQSKEAVKPPAESKPKNKTKLLDAILLRLVLAIAAVLLMFLGWQVFWKAVTPVTLLTSLPSQTVWALEQYVFSPLPIVNEAENLLNLSEKKPQYLFELPQEIRSKIDTLAPKRLLQSQVAFADNYFVNLVVETSKLDYLGTNDQVLELTPDGTNWYIKQFKPGFYQFTTNKTLLFPLASTDTLAYKKEYSEIFSNLPDQYYAAGLFDVAKIKGANTLAKTPILNEFWQKVTDAVGPTGFVVLPDNQKLNLITYSLPAKNGLSFPYNDKKYTAKLFSLLPENPTKLSGGLESAKRYLQLYQNSRGVNEPLAKQFDRIFAGLNLPQASFTFLTGLFNQELAYAKYYMPSGEGANVLAVADFNAEHIPLLTEILLRIHNYNNPVTVSFPLRDGSTGQKLVAGSKQELPLLQAAKNQLSYFTWNNGETNLPVFWGVLPKSKTLVFTDSAALWEKLSSDDITSIKESSIYYKNLLPALRASDELAYYDRAALQGLRASTYESEKKQSIVDLLGQVDSISISKNFFPDGLQTFSEFTFIRQPQ